MTKNILCIKYAIMLFDTSATRGHCAFKEGRETGPNRPHPGQSAVFKIMGSPSNFHSHL